MSIPRRVPIVLAIGLSAVPVWPQFRAEEVSAARDDRRRFSVDEKTIRIKKIGVSRPRRVAPPDDGGGLDELPPLGEIVNGGLDAWKIIVDNRPVVGARTQYASALPRGAAHWEQLAGWRPPEATAYAFSAKNIYGMTVVNVRYQIMRTCGGSYKGRGKYLTAVAVEPLFIEVAWGYRVTLEASAPPSGIVNVGPAENPVAGMTASLLWRISSPLKDSLGQSLFFLQGDGAFREVGKPFAIAPLAKARAHAAALARTERAFSHP